MSFGMDLQEGFAPSAPMPNETVQNAPSTMADRARATWAAGQRPDSYWNATGERFNRSQTIIDDLNERTGEVLLNPWQPGIPDEHRDMRMKKLRSTADKARVQFDPEMQDRWDIDSIDRDIATEGRTAEEKAARLQGTGGGLGAFAGSMAAGFVTPHGVATLAFPVSRMPIAAAEATIAGFLRNVGKEALLQSVIGAGTQAAITPLEYATRAQFGTEPSFHEMAEDILMAGAGGLVLGGAFRGTHLGIRRLMGRGGYVPAEVKDATLMAETRDLYPAKNPVGVPGLASEPALDKATADVTMNRPVSVDSIINPPQTVWHGSPHTFDQFSMSKIGTGEGGQTKGHGLYFAENKDVAIGYAEREGARHAAVDMDLNSSDFGTTSPAGGKLYEVRIDATPEQLLDLDKRLGEQSQAIQDFFREKGLGPEIKGETAYDALAVREGGVGTDLEAQHAAASKALNDAGIPGMRYLDKGSRAEGDGTRNLVLFDETRARIISRNGEPVTAPDPELKRLVERQEAPTTVGEVKPPPTTAAPQEPTLTRKAEVAQADRALDAQVRQLVAEDGPATAAQRDAMEAAEQAEKEARIAINCVGGAI